MHFKDKDCKMSKVGIPGWPGKNVDSRPSELIPSDVGKAADVVIPEFDSDVLDEASLPISESSAEVIMSSFDKQQASYVLQCAAKGKVRVAQDAIREHNAGYGRNNPEYTKLSNSLNVVTQELAAATQVYLLDKASYANDKGRVGRDVRF